MTENKQDNILPEIRKGLEEIWGGVCLPDKQFQVLTFY